MILGSFKQREVGRADLDDDTWVDRCISDFDDMSIQLCFLGPRIPLRRGAICSSLVELLANIVSVYERADDANRRLCNQAFVHRIFIEEDGDVRVEYERPFGSLCDTEEQMNALNWAAEAKKKGEAQTGQRVETLVEGLNLSHLG